jgi:uncharacterized protein
VGRIVHFDLVADEPERVIDFYSKTFGWKFEKWDGPMEYWLVATGPEDELGIDGGLSRRSEENPTVVNSVAVDSLDETLRQVEANGGTVVVPRGPIPGVGWYAQIRDPDGNGLGLIEEDADAQ